MANLVTTYILWLVGGWFGLHHFYLGRDRHGFVWFCTCGGFFGLGWLRDLWRIPDYVDECNGTEDSKINFATKVNRYPCPPFSVVRFAGEIMMGNLFGYLSLGVYIVGNIGREQVSFKWCLIGSYCGLLWTIKDIENVAVLPTCCTFVLRWKGVKWRLYKEKKQSICWRIPKITFFILLYLSLLCSTIYFNAYITTKDEEKVYLRDAVNNFFKSPAWEETKDSFTRLYNYYKVNGWGKLWEEVIEAFDPKGENNAYKVLGLSASSSQEQITAQYRKLVRKWHPDKHKDPEEKEEAQKKFIEIQEAYDILSSIKTVRAMRNKKSAKNPT
ncbi:hypothetical protein LOTGIDRAFT_179176 [Lottia gigantea]|uniref:DnaJ homolog subfamily C member 22 n=1 Tax=Lottia gigantea TaxID=225164 RepID=V3ZUE3_LOTGI|nr:hypothetical protein LOTGIDRAFT_179176 [Lottia gigantea]ESO87977.1 hypothetical protein LOTGIDRAFT_179176 [Lottia gigantea]